MNNDMNPIDQLLDTYPLNNALNDESLKNTHKTADYTLIYTPDWQCSIRVIDRRDETYQYQLTISDIATGRELEQFTTWNVNSAARFAAGW